MSDGARTVKFGGGPRRVWSSIRFRLLAIALLPTLVVLPLFLTVTFINWSSRFDNLLIAKVNGELTIAHQYLARILESNGLQVKAFGESATFARMIASGSDDEIFRGLDDQRATLGLDFLYYLDGAGGVYASPRINGVGNFAKWPVVQSALSGTQANAIDIFTAEDLALVSPELAQRARIDLVPTKAAVPSQRLVENRGMVLHTASPVQTGGTGGALVSGTLLNRNLEFIDTINDLVYPNASLTEGSQGTATIFLEDVRVSTNVRLFQNVRALGTRVSAEVRRTVLEQGNVWLDRAFVVNDWYLSGYEPIIDGFGNRVGMLYVGFLDTPFQAAKRQTLLTFAAVFLIVVLLTVPIFLRWAGGIFRPLERMVRTISRVESGDLGARTRGGPAKDEIGRVAGHLDVLLDQVQDRDRALRDWADELNKRVAERTRELREANQRLEATTKQLVMSEKLAAIGEIAAGIAHEINNPIAVIQGNLDVIRQEIGPRAETLQTEFSLIEQQVHSVNIIVNKLLQFTRPDEFVDSAESQHPSEVINDSIPLVHHLLNNVAIELQTDLQAKGRLLINRTELQQVLINLMVNAIHAMPDGGVLTIRTRDAIQDGLPWVVIAVSDTGKGMDETIMSRVFDPFFTTKKGDGTGLGLSISKKLISRYQGTIVVESTPNKGTCFEIRLPAVEGETSSALRKA